MIHKIANLLRDEIKDLDFVSLAVGIAKPLVLKINTSAEEPTFIQKRVPSAYREPDDVCQTGEQVQLVPDTTKLSIHFWEDLGMEPTSEDTYYNYVVANLRLVSWWNLPAINSSYTDASILVANLIANIPEKLDNTDYLTQIRVSFAGAEPEGAAVVANYDFDEPENQFTTFPYVYTALNYQIDFAFTKNCVDSVILNPEICP